MLTFSVVMSVYRNDKPEYVTKAIESITINQTIQPSEVVIVVDGPVSQELKNQIITLAYSNTDLYNVIWLPKNKGLGNALRIGVVSAKYEIIARMDSDDISVPNRFESQIDYLENHQECTIVGGQISEFIGNEDNVVGVRKVPISDNEIKSYLLRRCPFNHMSVMFRKSAIISIGNYIDWYFNEDYYLWIRMAQAGYKFANLPDNLVYVRVGKEMYQRRGGWRYFKSEANLQRYMLKNRIISFPRYLYNVTGRFAIQVAIPNKLRGFIFQKLFRK